MRTAAEPSCGPPRDCTGGVRTARPAAGGARRSFRDGGPRFVACGWAGRRHAASMQSFPPETAMPDVLAHMPPLIAIHAALALGALVLGPFALWARKGSAGHRAAGYAWITLMLGAAVSALFIRDFKLPNLAGYTPIHLLVPLTFAGIGRALWFILARRNVTAHRRSMRLTYVGAVGAGLFALLPARRFGLLVWQHWAALA